MHEGQSLYKDEAAGMGCQGFQSDLDLIAGVRRDREEYIEFIVHQLKPAIDKKYRTLPEEASMGGSSMGGLISTDTKCVYYHVFKKLSSIVSANWFNQK
ncbi:alpha/beta hydrolase-fold protein [Lysinibacillus sphaericus]